MEKVFLLAAGLTLAIAMTACSGQSGERQAEDTAVVQEATTEQVTEEVQTEAQTETASKADATGTLPAYVYTDDDKVEAAIADYILAEFSKDYDPADVAIPSVNIVEDDERDSADIKAWGIYEIGNYNLNEAGDTLEYQSGGVYPGLMHLEADGNGGYKVKSFDMVADGSDFTESAKEIFGKHYNEFMEDYSDNERADEQKDAIEEYVLANKLPITHYQNPGWDPVALDLDD